MTPAELELHDAAERVRLTEAGIRELKRGIAIRRAGGACTVQPMLDSLARLETRLTERRAHLDALRARHAHRAAA